MLHLLLLLFCATVNVIANPAINLIKCKPNDDTCVTNSVKAAYPLILQPNAEIGAEEMDPLFQKVIEGNLSILKFKLFNTSTTGFKTCEIKSAKYNEAAETMQLNFLCNKFDLGGQYDINGQLIVLPVQGTGDYALKTKKYKMDVELELNTISKDGKNYKHIKGFKVKADPIENVFFDFQNLFNGNKELADTVLKFANENWKEVAHEVQEPVFVANLKKIVRNANKYLKTISIDEYTSQ